MDYKQFTIADLVQELAGKPPMMPVVIFDSDLQLPKYIYRLEIWQPGKGERIPILGIWITLTTPDMTEDTETYEQKLDRKREQAMHMQHEKDKANQMPPMVE
jgi:hypothetical protein